MEAERKRKLTRRNPLSDCTNTSSSSLSRIPTKPDPSYYSSAPKKPTTTRFTSSTNLDHATNPTSPPPTTLLSTPSPKPSSLNVQVGRNIRKDEGKEVAIPESTTPILNKRKDKGKEVAIPVSITPIFSKRNDEGTFDVEASEPISAVYSRRSFSNLRKGKGKEVEIPVSSTSILNKRKDKGKEVRIPASITPILSKINDKGKDVAISLSDTSILTVSSSREKSDGVQGANLPKTKALADPCRKRHHAVSSEQDDELQDPASKKRKDREKETAIPVSSTPILQVSDSRERNYGGEGENLPKAKAFTDPCRKKQRIAFEDCLLQDYIEKQKAYFKMIDDFELPVEEVCSINEIE